MRNGNTTTARQGLFRQLFLQYFDVEACARSALGPYWQNATAQDAAGVTGLRGNTDSPVRSINTLTHPISYAGAAVPAATLDDVRSKLAALIGL